MSGVTDADRERSKALRQAIGQVASWPERDAMIAAAFAEERTRAFAEAEAVLAEGADEHEANSRDKHAHALRFALAYLRICTHDVTRRAAEADA